MIDIFEMRKLNGDMGKIRKEVYTYLLSVLVEYT